MLMQLKHLIIFKQVAAADLTAQPAQKLNRA